MKTADSLYESLSKEHVREKVFQAGYFFGDLVNHVGTTSAPLLRLGVTNEEMRDATYQERIHPDDRPNYMRLWHRLNDGRTDELYCEYRVKSADGNWHWIETHAVVVERTEHGTIGKVMGFDRIIDTRKQSEELLSAKLQEAQQKIEINEAMRRVGANMTLDGDLRNMLEQATRELAAVITFDSAEVVTLAGKETQRVYGTSPSNTSEVRSNRETLQELRNMLSESLYPIIVDNPPGVRSEGSLLLVPLRVHDQLVGMVLLWRYDGPTFSGDDLYPVMALTDSLATAVYDRSYFRETVTRLEHDGLTGFLTRSAFDREVPALWDEYKSLHPVNAIAMLDIDRFKQVNDTYGHAAGDEVLRKLAELMRDGLRQEDILVRYGGEEFVVILPNTNADTAVRIVDRLREDCSASKEFNLPIPVTFSAGIAECAQSHCDLQSLLQQADLQLYRAKRGGRNRVCR
ncbi:MAG: diguanylate cyclase [Spirochaetales bacterium]